MGLGAVRLSVRELILEVADMKKSINEKYIKKQRRAKGIF